MSVILSFTTKLLEQCLRELGKMAVGCVLLLMLCFLSVTGKEAARVAEAFLIELPSVGKPLPEPPESQLLETLILIEEESSTELEVGYDRNIPLLD